MSVDSQNVLASVAAIVLFVAAAFLVAQTVSLRRVVETTAERNLRITVVNPDGTVLYDTEGAMDNHANREEVREAMRVGRGLVTRRSETTGKYLIYCAYRIGTRIVRLALPYGGWGNPEWLARYGFPSELALGLAGVVLVIFVALRVSRRIDFQAREIEMSAANEAFRREFTANVTHELMTPLTAILGAIEVFQDGDTLTGDERSEVLGIVREQAGRLNALSKDVLSLAQIEREQTTPHTHFADVPVDEIVEAVLTLETPRAKQADVQLLLVRNDKVSVRGEAQLLEQALINLVENALRYSGSKTVEVASASENGTVKLSVTDFGIGIPRAHLPHLFERFYRVDKARSRALGGTGLGLAIVKHIALLHGGTVQVVSEQGRRTTFTITLKAPTAGNGAKSVLVAESS
ncbi:MAG: hypothetical protein J6334_01195 [Kiritimatiellae bacterium]|nr:hypothetical protein [Kiritimatiellia bacterium]